MKMIPSHSWLSYGRYLSSSPKLQKHHYKSEIYKGVSNSRSNHFLKKIKMFSEYNNENMDAILKAVGHGKGKHALKERRKRVNKYEVKNPEDPYQEALKEQKRCV